MKVPVFSVGIVLLMVTTSCAPFQKLLGKKTKLDVCNERVDSLQNALSKEKTKNTENESAIKSLREIAKNYVTKNDSLMKLATYQKDTIVILKKENNSLVDKQEKLAKDNAAEAKKIMSELQSTREDLQKREDKLTALQNDLEKERARLQKLGDELSAKDQQLSSKDQQLRQLQSLMQAKDSAANALKQRLSAALKGFEGNGLSITQREGIIYVSLDEKLLFELGKSEVNTKGADAIQKLTNVLEKNPDINILVEGHTDNTGSAKFNWKLSTERALAISSIILENPKVDGKRVTAAGRGQFSPIDDNVTVQGRTKNRRCEIILTPKLDELYKLIQD